MKKVFFSTALLVSAVCVMADEVVLPSNVSALLPDGVTASVTYLAENVKSRTREAKPMISTGTKLYFAAQDATHGEELWVSDGTAAGTKMVAEIAEGSLGSDPQWLTAVGETIYFQANDGVHGAELWVTDGTAAGTKMVKDIYEGETGSAPQAITALGNKVLFFAFDEESEFTPVIPGSVDEKWLWVTDGTEAGTERIGDTPTKLDMDGTRGCIVVANNKGVFAGYDTKNNETIWATDGTKTGTAPLLNINPRKDTVGGVFETEAASIDHLVSIDNRMVAFRADAVKEVTGADIDWGVEMWITDGTTAGTKQIGFPINKLEKDGKYASSDFRQTYPIGDHLYFRANNGNKAVNGAEPWVWYIDQKIEEGVNPKLIQDLAHNKNVLYYNAHPSCFYEYKDYLYLAANFTYSIVVSPDSTRMWDSDYHTLCRGKISEIEDPDSYDNKPIQGEYLWTGFEIFPGDEPFTHKFCTVNDTLFFVCRDAETNYELWKLDSKTAGSAEFDKPVKVMDLPGDGQICYTTNLNEQLYFISATTGQLYHYAMDVKEPQAVENTEAEDMSTRKIIRNGQVLIMRNGIYYNMMGTTL